MEPQPTLVTFEGLYRPANTRLKGKELAVEKESNDVSLELSLSSCNKTFHVNPRKEDKMMIRTPSFPLEKSDDVSLELSLWGYSDSDKTMKSQSVVPSEKSDVSLELCIWGYPHESKPKKKKDHMSRLGKGSGKKKRERVETCCARNVSSPGNYKRIKFKAQHQGEPSSSRRTDDPWCIKKILSESDLGDMTRLLLNKRKAITHILELWDDDVKSKITQGIPVIVLDRDTMTEHDMVFKKWGKDSHVLIKNWNSEFVKRRQLKLADEIGLFWDQTTSKFNFSLLNRAPR